MAKKSRGAQVGTMFYDSSWVLPRGCPYHSHLRGGDRHNLGYTSATRDSTQIEEQNKYKKKDFVHAQCTQSRVDAHGQRVRAQARARARVCARTRPSLRAHTFTHTRTHTFFVCNILALLYSVFLIWKELQVKSVHLI